MFLLGAYAKGERNRVFKPCRRNLILFNSLGDLLLMVSFKVFVLHCAFLLRMILASLARAHEHVRIQNVIDSR